MTFDDFSKFHDFPWLFQKILFFQVFQVFQTLWEPCHTALQLLKQNINQNLNNPTSRPHRPAMGCLLWRFEKIDVIMALQCIYKTFREEQHPRPAISNYDPFHGTLNNATKFQAVTFPDISHLPGPSLSWKISKFRETCEKWQGMAILHRDLL